MTTNVTVLGASGSTVTIPFTSAANAAAAQASLGVISTSVLHASVIQQNLGVGGTIAASGAVGVGAVATIAGVSASTPSTAYDFISTVGSPSISGSSTVPAVSVNNSAAQPLVVADGGGGVALGNQATVIGYFGGGNLVYSGSASAVATLYVDGVNNLVTNTSSTATANVLAYGGSAITFGGSGSSSVYAQSGSETLSVASGALSVFGSSGSNISLNAASGATAYINNTLGGTLVVGSGAASLAGGAVTAFGGASGLTALYTHGLVQDSSSASKDSLFSDTLAGATTLVGAGANDTIGGVGVGNFYSVSGSGANTIYDAAGYGTAYGGTAVSTADAKSEASSGATYVTTGTGADTVYGSWYGNAKLYAGSTSTTAILQHTDASGTQTSINSIVETAKGITISVYDFALGNDAIFLQAQAGTTVSSTSNISGLGGAAGTQFVLSDGTTVNLYAGNNLGSSTSTIFYNSNNVKVAN